MTGPPTMRLHTMPWHGLQALDKAACKDAPENVCAIRRGRNAHLHLPVKASGPPQRRVYHLWPVGGCHNHHPAWVCHSCTNMHAQSIKHMADQQSTCTMECTSTQQGTHSLIRQQLQQSAIQGAWLLATIVCAQVSENCCKVCKSINAAGEALPDGAYALSFPAAGHANEIEVTALQ